MVFFNLMAPKLPQFRAFFPSCLLQKKLFKFLIVTNLSLAKGTANFTPNFLPNFLIKLPINPRYWIILDNWALLSVTSANILLAKLFLILGFYLVANSTLSWNFFFILLFLMQCQSFFAGDSKILSWVFVKLTLASS